MTLHLREISMLFREFFPPPGGWPAALCSLEIVSLRHWVAKALVIARQRSVTKNNPRATSTETSSALQAH